MLDVVVFLDAEWDEDSKKNRQHFLIMELSRQLSGRSKVLGVERPICPWTAIFCKHKKFIQWLGGKRGLRRVRESFYIYTPFILVHNLMAAHIPGMTSLNRYLLRILLRRVLKQAGFHLDRLLVWIHHPYQLEDLGLLGEKLLVYDCYDDYFSHLPPRWLVDLRKREAAILSRSDIVFVVSEWLLELKKANAKEIHLIPNGVEVDLFAQVMSNKTEIPTEMAVLSHPVVGFIGRIGAWLNFELLVRLVGAHPDRSFVFVGPHDGDGKLAGCPDYLIFRKSPNVHFIGPKPHEILPRYLKVFDVCIIPYLLEGQVPASSSLKLYEYLASGRPIVSVDIPSVACLRPFVYIAKNTDDFDQAIDFALAEENNEELRQQRLIAARNNSWENRAHDALAVIEKSLKERRV